MGKSNRIRVNRANDKVQSLNTRPKKKGMPSWALTLITLVVTVAILLSVALSLLVENGVFNRLTPAMKSEHFTVNSNMMAYYFHTQYNEFYNNYSSMMSSFSLDTSVSLKEQTFGGSEEDAAEGTTYMDSMLDADLAEEGGTWFDYFMKQTQTSVESVLVYCEEAYERNGGKMPKLTDEEKDALNESMKELETTAASYGYTTNAYISAIYGKGVRTTDLRKAMTYSTIAANCMNEVSEELNDAITDADITGRYEENTRKYDLVDYTSYTFEVEYDDVAEELLGEDYATELATEGNKEQVDAEYLARVQATKEKAELMTLTDSDAFLTNILTNIAEETVRDLYDEELDAVNEDAEDADKVTEPAAESVTAILAAMKVDAVKEVMDGEETAKPVAEIEEDDETVTVYNNISVSAEYAAVLNTVKESLFTELTEGKDSAVVDQASFTDDADEEEESFSDWAFDSEDAVAGATKLMVDGDETTVPETAESEGVTYSATVYLVRTARYRDETLSRNVAYMLFSTQDAAEKAITALKEKEELSLEIFEAYAEEITTDTANTHLENYTAGTIGSTTFDNWLFADNTELGTITDTALSLSTDTYAVAYYYGEGDPAWEVTVRSELLNERYEDYYNTMVETFGGEEHIVVKEKACNKIDA